MFHISWVDYGGQRIYHLLECLSSGKLKNIYKHCLINPYIKTCREKRRKTQHCHVQVPSEEVAWDTKRLWAGLHEAQVSGPVGPMARSPGLWLKSEIQPLWRNQFTVRSDFLKQISFPWISSFHRGHPFKKKLEHQWEYQSEEISIIYWAFIMGQTPV